VSGPSSPSRPHMAWSAEGGISDWLGERAVSRRRLLGELAPSARRCHGRSPARTQKGREDVRGREKGGERISGCSPTIGLDRGRFDVLTTSAWAGNTELRVGAVPWGAARA
jgi:hypothetical protein